MFNATGVFILTYDLRQFDYAAFRARYVYLRSLYGNSISDIPIVSLEDEEDIWAHIAKFPKRRLTFGAHLANVLVHAQRSTEELALARCYGFMVLDCDLLVRAQRPPEIPMWHCIGCGKKKPLTDFEKSDKYPQGYGHSCANCRVDKKRYVWRRTDEGAAAVAKVA